MIIAECRNKMGGDVLRPFLIAYCRMRRERNIRPTKTCKFNILQESRRPDKRSASGTLALLTPLNIDMRRFQSVLFDKRTARFNGVAHKLSEQLVVINLIFNANAQHTTAFRVHGGFFRKAPTTSSKSPMIITCKALRVDPKSIDLRDDNCGLQK